MGSYDHQGRQDAEAQQVRDFLAAQAQVTAARMWTCMGCGAMVHEAFKRTHEGWHARHGERPVAWGPPAALHPWQPLPPDSRQP